MSERLYDPISDRPPNGTSHLPPVANDAARVRCTHENLSVALELVAAGLPVFPATEAKRPLVPRWQERATLDTAQIRQWWNQWPDAIPGIELGRAGLVVIDEDRHGGPDGVAAMAELAAQ